MGAKFDSEAACEAPTGVKHNVHCTNWIIIIIMIIIGCTKYQLIGCTKHQFIGSTKY